MSNLFTIERPASGGNFALLRGESDFTDEEKPFRAVHGAGYRAVYDLADMNKSVYLQATGQSGHFKSPFYGHFLKKWANVDSNSFLRS